MKVLWFLPTHGDGRYLASSSGGRPLTHDYLRQIAQAADQLGYYGVLLPTGRSCEDSWVVGSSAAGIEVATDQCDVYLTWGEPPAAVAAKIAAVRAAAGARGRSLRFGIRLHVIVRETREAAWAAARDLIRYVDDQVIADAQKVFARYDSVGQQRMAALHGGDPGKLEISPDLWAGVGLVRGGAGTALVGDPQTVAARMQEYAELGIESFILSGYPHLEEAYRFAELVFPLLTLSHAPSRGAPPVAALNGPFGEIIANERTPKPAAKPALVSAS